MVVKRCDPFPDKDQRDVSQMDFLFKHLSLIYRIRNVEIESYLLASGCRNIHLVFSVLQFFFSSVYDFVTAIRQLNGSCMYRLTNGKELINNFQVLRMCWEKTFPDWEKSNNQHLLGIHKQNTGICVLRKYQTHIFYSSRERTSYL